MYPVEYRWISMLTPVTNMHLVIDRGATRAATFTCKPPTGIQLKYVCVNCRWEVPSRPASVMQAATNEPATAAVPTQPAHGSPIRRPAVTSTTKPARGSRGIRNATWSTLWSALHRVEGVGVGA